jgi:hypothetical protein
MPRKLRYVPENRTLLSITNRTIQGRHLLRPGSRLNDIFLGTLGWAQRRHYMRIHAVTALSSHYHLLLSADDAEQLAGFMRDFQSKLAREVNRLTGWRGPVFERRYEMTVVTDEEKAQVERLRYLLSNGVKESLVEHVRDWPGAHSAAALIDGAPLIGHWFNRTREYASRQQGETFSPLRFASEETVVLSPIPLLGGLGAGRLPPTRKSHSGRHRHRSRASPQELRKDCARRRRDSGPRPAVPARQARALPRPARPCRDEGSPQTLPADLRCLRQRLPGSD